VQPSAEAEFAKLNLPSLFCQAYFAKLILPNLKLGKLNNQI
jgi:hypothetical protein